MSRNIHLLTYKNKVQIPPLAMIDDILAPALCGIRSVAVNTFINTKAEMRKFKNYVEKLSWLAATLMRDIAVYI